VLLDEFLLPGEWRLALVPDDVVAEPEDRARLIEIRLERVAPPFMTLDRP
jgi:hypothetical protein